MPTTVVNDITENLKDPEYAKLYGEEDAKLNFAITLLKIRKRLNLTQKKLADKIGVSQLYIAKLEGGEANPTLGHIGSLLALLNKKLVTDTVPLVSYFVEYLDLPNSNIDIKKEAQGPTYYIDNASSTSMKVSGGAI
jgi:transcriptional regulator with XRE-family HTH domain